MNQFLIGIDASGCAELPFVESAAQTYFDYLNGAAGYVVFVVGAALLLISMVSRKQLGKTPGWLSSIIIVALILGSLPALMSAFGINLGCGGADASVVEPPTTAAASFGGEI